MADKKKEPIACLRCQHIGDENDKHCVKCGAPLINRCGDEPGGLLSNGCSHVNRPDAAYCAKCGHPTLFHKEGLITPHQPIRYPVQVT